MVEYDRTQDREHLATPPVKICVVGVGGAGLNVLDRIALDRIVDSTLIGMHTDVRVLSHAMTQHKLQLGTELMRGIGSGGDPELGRCAAEGSRESIRSLVQGHDMVFICAGLGGGTGSGAVPVVAQVAKDCGALVFIFATTPFSFEGRRRLVQAEMSLEQLQASSDALILFENNRMAELVLPREGIQKAFSQADQIMGHSVRAITSMVTQPGLVRLGLSDLMSALRSPNARCLFGFGEARGANRVAEALKKTLKSPLIHQGQLLNQAQNLIVHVAGGDTLTLAEVEGLMKQLGKLIPEHTQILFGVSVDAKLGDSLALTLLSSLSAQQMACEIKTTVTEAADTVAAAEEAPAPVTPVIRAKIATTPAPRPAYEIELPVSHTSPARPAKARTEPAPTVKSVATPAPVQQTKPEPQPEPEPELPPAAILAKPAAMTPSPQPVAKEVAEVESILEKPLPIAKAPLPPAPPAKEQEEEDPPTLIKTSIFSVIDDEPEAAEEFEVEAEVTPPPPAVVPKPVSRSKVHPKSHLPPPRERDEEEESEAEPVVSVKAPAAPRPEPALAGAGRSSSMLQPTLNLHQDEIARFKGTDKTIVEGEDLDIPTWMRVRQKSRH